MSRHESLAIVLRRWPYSEHSQVVHLLTPRAGLVPVLAKGVHRLGSGKAGVLDTHALVRVVYSEKPDQELRTLVSAELMDRYSGVSRRVDAMNAAGLLAELAELAAPPDTPSSEPFLFLVQCLQELDARPYSVGFLVPRVLRACALLGLTPDLGPRSLDRPAWFSIAAGRLEAVDAPRPEGAAWRLRPPVHAALVRGCEEPEQDLEAAENDLDDCLTMLGQFLGYHLERPPRAWKAIEERRSHRPVAR